MPGGITFEFWCSSGAFAFNLSFLYVYNINYMLWNLEYSVYNMILRTCLT